MGVLTGEYDGAARTAQSISDKAVIETDPFIGDTVQVGRWGNVLQSSSIG